jgi:hypothetical protein
MNCEARRREIKRLGRVVEALNLRVELTLASARFFQGMAGHQIKAAERTAVLMLSLADQMKALADGFGGKDGTDA